MSYCCVTPDGRDISGVQSNIIENILCIRRFVTYEQFCSMHGGDFYIMAKHLSVRKERAMIMDTAYGKKASM